MRERLASWGNQALRNVQIAHNATAGFLPISKGSVLVSWPDRRRQNPTKTRALVRLMIVTLWLMYSSVQYTGHTAKASTAQAPLTVISSSREVTIENIRAVKSGAMVTLVNHLEVFYEVTVVNPRALVADSFFWSHRLITPYQRLVLHVSTAAAGAPIQIQCNPSTLRAVAEDEAELTIRVIETLLGIDVDPVDVINAAPELWAIGTELAGINDFSAPAGDIGKLLKASSDSERLQLMNQTAWDLAKVLSKTAVLKRLAPQVAKIITELGKKVSAKQITLLGQQFQNVATAVSVITSAGKVVRCVAERPRAPLWTWSSRL